MKAIVMNRAGGTEVLELADRPDPVPGPGQALVEVAAAGVNFMDTGVRRGQFWPEIPLPRVLGVEGMGRVLAVDEIAASKPLADLDPVWGHGMLSSDMFVQMIYSAL